MNVLWWLMLGCAAGAILFGFNWWQRDRVARARQARSPIRRADTPPTFGRFHTIDGAGPGRPRIYDYDETE